MNSIMIDNWTLDSIAYDYRHCSNGEISDEYARFLSAVILWDEIYYPDNEKSYWKGCNDMMDSILKPIFDKTHLFEMQSEDLYCEYYEGNERKLIAKEAIRYLLISDFYNCDYLPSKQRQEFLSINSPYEIVKRINVLNRINYMNTLDNSINRTFTEIGRMFGDIEFVIKRPVLVDFIMQNTPKGMTYLDVALHLRQEGPVVKYRQYLSDVETAIEKKQWKVLSEMVQYSEKIVSETVNIDKRSICSANIAILPMPSLNFSKEIGITRRNIHLSFLETLSQFAFDGRNLLMV